MRGTISDIGAVLDPSIRTAKVRIQVDNPKQILRLGMFVTATLYGNTQSEVVAVPAAAVLHLHDRDWVYIPAEGDRGFLRVEVNGGNMLPGSLEQITSGIKAGQHVVSNALELQNTTEQ